MGFKLGKIFKVALGVALVVGTGGAAAGVFGLSTAVGGSIAAGLGLSGWAAAAVGLAGTLIGTSLITSALTPKAGYGGDQSVQDALGTRQLIGANTANKLPWVIGGDTSGAYISGIITDVVWSTDNQTAWYVLALSEVGSTQTFTFDTSNIYWSDKRVVFDGTDQTKVIQLVDNTGATDTRINNELYMYLFPNGATTAGQNTAQTAQQVMQDSGIPVANRWPATNTMSNTCFAIVKIIYNATDGTTGLQPPTFRLQSNMFKAGDVWYEYMTNKVFGCGFDPSIVDTASRTALNTYGDQLITYTPSGGGATQTITRYRLNGVIDTKLPFRSNLDNIMAACDSWLRWDEVNGIWKVAVNQAQTSVASYNDDSIIDNIQFSPKLTSDTFTSIEVSFPDGLIRDQQNNAYIALPDNLKTKGQPDNQLSLSLLLVNDNIRAQYLANRILEQNIEDLIISFNAPFSAIGLEAGDVIDITNVFFGWTGKLFRISQVTEIMDEAKGIYAKVTCFEYNAEVYDNFNITQYTPAPNTGLGDPSFFGTLVAPTITNQTPNIGIPTFTINGTVPASGICNQLDFYVNTTNTPVGSTLLLSVPNPSGGAFAPSTIISKPITGLNTGNYYFFTQAKNTIGTSSFSTPSVLLTWVPVPASQTTGVAANFEWSPVTSIILADAGGTPLSLPQVFNLQLFLGLTPVNVTTATTDPTMPNNTWRITNSIIAGTVTITGPIVNGATNFAYTLTSMTSSAATLRAVVNYKDNTGTITTLSSPTLSITKVNQGASGASGYLNNGFLILNQNNDGSFPVTTNNVVANFILSGVTTNYIQPVTLTVAGLITYGTPSGSTGINVVTTGSGTRQGTIIFTQTSTGLVLVADVLVQLIPGVTTTYIIYQRGSVTPTTPSGGSINTATGVLTPPSGWFNTPPAAAGDILYQSQNQITYSVNTGVLTITTLWSSPFQSSQTFVNGGSYVWTITGSIYVPAIANLTIYQRSASGVAPPTPIGGAYTFSSGVINPPSGWSVSEPTASYDPLYSSTSRLTTIGLTNVVTPIWDSPVFIAQPVGKIANTKVARAGNRPVSVPIPTATEINTAFGRQTASFGDAIVLQYADFPASFTYNGTTWTLASTFISGDAVVDGTITARTIAAATITGDKIVATTITSDKLNVNQLSAISANLGLVTAGSITVGSSPAISATTMTGSGAVINPSGLPAGAFALGNATTNLTFDGTALTLNGRVVYGSNVAIDGATIVSSNNSLRVGSINSNQVVNNVGPVTYSTSVQSSTFVGSNVSTTFADWSSKPSTTASVTVQISYVVTANTASFPSMTLTIGGGTTSLDSEFISFSSGQTPSGTVSLLTTATNLYSIINLTIRLSVNVSAYISAVTVVFNGVTNPSPATKTLVYSPGFNTYP